MNNLQKPQSQIYRGIAKKSGSLVISTPTQYVPMPDIEDYTRGWFLRYFIRKTNDVNAPILEVNENQYEALYNVKYYIRTTIRWKIYGPREEVSETNAKIIDLTKYDFPGLSSRLPNLLQYWERK